MSKQLAGTKTVRLNYKRFQELHDTTTLSSTSGGRHATTSVKWVESTGGKLLRNAQSFQLGGDEEQAYIAYLQAANVYKNIRHDHPDFALDSELYNSMIKCNLDEAMQKCVELKTSLERRYADQEEGDDNDELSSRHKDDDEKEVGAEEMLRKLKTKTHHTVPELKILMESGSNILIVDHRPFQDFVKGHLNHPNCINVSPQAFKTAGQSVRKMDVVISSSPAGKKLHWADLWLRRRRFDKVILYDADSTVANVRYFSGKSAEISVLFASMIEDGCSSAILDGGYATLYSSFPSLVVLGVAVSHLDVKSGNVPEQGGSHSGNSSGSRPVISFAAAANLPPAQKRAQNVKKIEMTKEEHLVAELTGKEQEVEALTDIIRMLNDSLKEAREKYEILEQMSFLNRVGDPCHLGTPRRTAGATKLDAGKVFYCGKKKVKCDCWNKKACDGICGPLQGCPCDDCLQLTFEMMPNIRQKVISAMSEEGHAFNTEDPVQVARKLLEAENPNAFCVICLERKRSTVLDPCGHYSYCELCVYEIKECSICRGKFEKTLKVFDG